MTTFFVIGVCPLSDLSSLFQYPTPVVSLHLIPKIQYHPGIPITLLTGSSLGVSSSWVMSGGRRKHQNTSRETTFIVHVETYQL